MIVFTSGVSHVKKKGVVWWSIGSTPPPSSLILPPLSSCMFPYVVAWSGLTGQIHVFSLLAEMCAGDSSVTLCKTFAYSLRTLCTLSVHNSCIPSVHFYTVANAALSLVPRPYYFLLPHSLCMRLLLHSFHNVFILENMLLTVCVMWKWYWYFQATTEQGYFAILVSPPQYMSEGKQWAAFI